MRQTKLQQLRKSALMHSKTKLLNSKPQQQMLVATMVQQPKHWKQLKLSLLKPKQQQPMLTLVQQQPKQQQKRQQHQQRQLVAAATKVAQST